MFIPHNGLKLKIRRKLLQFRDDEISCYSFVLYDTWNYYNILNSFSYNFYKKFSIDISQQYG